MNWIILIIAGLLEVGFATCLGKVRESSGQHATMWFAGFLVCLVMSIYLLYRVTETLPVGTSYAVWTGIGAFGIVVIGIFVFNEPATFWRIFFLTTLIISIICLRLVSPSGMH
jgi:quaternary ammonium compound-resistance protein SugE